MKNESKLHPLANIVGTAVAVLSMFAYEVSAQSLIWFNGKDAVTYSVSKSASPVVGVALDMLDEDLRKVTGLPTEQTDRDHATIQILQMDKEGKDAIGRLSSIVPVDSLCGLKEAFFITARQGKLIVAGADARGTAYGILELSRLAGVSPWVWWADVVPERRERLTLPAGYRTLQSPSVEYRGIFLNDEDWSLQPWSWKHFSPNPPGMISAETYKKIFQLLIRLRANTIWPAMHGMSVPFYRVPGAKEMADSLGIVIGTSHCEPLMRNNVGEWKVEERGRYNYMTNREAVQAYWTERLKEAAPYENIYTLGMRGIHDGSMEGVETLGEKTDALQQVIDDQRELLARYVDRNVEQIPQQFVPYKEVLQIMENGLVVPEDVTLTWCDDNYGYMTRLSDSIQQKRSGGGGIYYHLSYWGRPHDYMWLTTTQPGLIYNEMRQAYDCNVRKLWIVNVHDLKTPSYDLELFLDLAWDIHAVSPSTIWEHYRAWLSREFSPQVAEWLMPPMQEYWRLVAIRKPEFMGWSQVEVDKKQYARGWTPVADTEFSLTAFGGELDRYLSGWSRVADGVLKAEEAVPAHRRDAFFAHIKYPVLGAQAMSIKMLEAQRARDIAKANYDPERWQRDKSLHEAVAKSVKAYQRIRQLTAFWNDSLADGKWKYSMCDHPRDLYVFYAPWLPVALADEETGPSLSLSYSGTFPLPSGAEDFIARNACQYDFASPGAEPVQCLGHSMNAVSLPKGGTLVYDIDCQTEGEAVLRTAVIPTHPIDKGDIRFSISIDGGTPQVCSFKEGFRSEGWKRNVLRGQAIRETRHYLTQGKHTLAITALDNHVVIDQWMIDFDPDRKFYVFPITNH